MKWIETTVGEFCPFVYGKALPKTKRVEGSIPVFGSNGCVDHHSESYVKGPGIIVGRKGSVGEVHLSKVPFWPIDTSFYVEKNTLEELKFTFYLLKSLGLDGMNSDSAVPGLNRENAHSIPIKVPELKEDREKLGHWISVFDEKISLNREMNQTLESIAHAIFKSWFVDFEPTRAKISAKENGQDPERAAMAAIAGKELDELEALSADQLENLKSTAALFPDKLVESELGEIPIGWHTENLSDEIDILNGFAFKSKDYSEKGTFVLRTKNFNVSNETERLHDDVFLPESFLISHEKYMAKPFDYHLIMVGASVGNRGIIYPCHLPALRNQNMWCFRAKKNSFVSQVYTKYLLDFLVVKSVGLASGSAREFFRKGDFGSQKICIGSEEIQAAFYKVVMPIFEKKASLVEENQILETLRNSLLPKLLSGEIDLVEQEKAVVNG